jgi:OOP family OmpA-OmpF porin
MRLFRTVVAVGAALLATSALAQSGLYITGGVGMGKAKFSDTDFPQDANFDRTSDTQDSTWNIGIGYRFSRNLAAELGYAELGEYNVRYANGRGPEAGNSFDQNYEVKAWKLAGVGLLPLGSSFSLLGKLGFARTTAELTDNFVEAGVPGTFNGKKSRNRLFWGIGAQYDFTPRLGLRLEYEDYGKVGAHLTGTGNEPGEAKISTFNLNVVYGF